MLFDVPDAPKVLTVRQPHAYLLIHGSANAGVKDVENRSQVNNRRGTVLIQASARVDLEANPATNRRRRRRRSCGRAG
jgi:hypothetical protein